jgi:RND family efflux transporter MFP subunit
MFRRFNPCHYDRFVFVVILLATSGTVRGTDLEGFTEPFRTLKVAADETGTIAEVLVQEGERVNAGQPLARLNSDVHEAMLAIAAKNMKADGRIRSAQADLQLRQSRLDKLRDILSEGFARQEEVDRAATEVEIAEANIHAAQEDIATKQLEHQKIVVQLRRRTIVAPIDGTVTILHKDQGEFVAPNTPEIVTLVQLDTLLANFTLTGSQAASLQLESELPIIFSEGNDCPGTIDFISPVMDAESGTVLVKVRIDNADRSHRSGQRCRIRLPD